MATEACLMKQTEKDSIIENSTILAAFPEQEVKGSSKVSQTAWIDTNVEAPVPQCCYYDVAASVSEWEKK